MEKITSISVGNRVFKVSNSAYEVLRDFEHFLYKKVGDVETKEETEKALAEFIEFSMPTTEEVVSYNMAADAVKHISKTYGLNYTPVNSKHDKKKLYRNTADSVLGGVCSGLADYFNIDPVIVRVLTVVSAFFTPAIIIYIVLWIIIPEKPLFRH